MKPIMIDATTINDLWHQTLFRILEEDETGFKHAYSTGLIQRGSYAGGQTRLQFPGFMGSISDPINDYCVKIPTHMLGDVPAPTTEEGIEQYFVEYIMGDKKPENTDYTYGERILLQVWRVIEILRASPITNQAVIEIAQPSDLELSDPPCLRLIDLKVVPVGSAEGIAEALKGGTLARREHLKLNLSVYFRSWDLFAGMPENLGGMSLLLRFIAEEADLGIGGMNCFSAGLHLYKHFEKLAHIRTKMAQGRTF